MPAAPLWGDAKPLPGCEVIRSPPAADPPPVRVTPVRKKPNAVVEKIAAANLFLDRSAQPSPAAALVWLLLWRDERGGTARTAVSDLARRSGLSARTVKRSLGALRRRGLVETVRHGSPSAGPTVYRLRPTRAKGVMDGP